MFRTTDKGQHWNAISPDLTRDDKSKQQWAGGPITGDNTGVEFYGTIFAIDESPLEPGLIWAGSDDGLVHVTRDNGKNWRDVTPPNLPKWASVACIQASRYEKSAAYLVADAHRLDDETPYLWKTMDYGETWSRLGMGKDEGALDPEVYLHVVREDPKVTGLLYLGTERGVMVSRDDGAKWESLRLNMPTVAIADLVVAENDLVIATLGRSAWILDDLTPIREMTPRIRDQDLHLFPVLPAYRWFRARSSLGSKTGSGKNPPAGVIFNYWLGKKTEQKVELEVLDSEGRLVRRLSSELQPQYTSEEHPNWDPDTELEPDLPVKQGLNRAAWDMKYEPTRWVLGTRNDSGSPQSGPRVSPGEYTLRLNLDDQVVTQVVRIKPDPPSVLRPRQPRLKRISALACANRWSLSWTALSVFVRSERSSNASLAELGDSPDSCSLITAGKSLSEKLLALEVELHNPAAEVDYDVLAGRQGGAKLYSPLTWLSSSSSNHAGPPTQGMLEVAATIDQEIKKIVEELDRLFAEDLATINEQARSTDVPFIRGAEK